MSGTAGALRWIRFLMNLNYLVFQSPMVIKEAQ